MDADMSIEQECSNKRNYESKADAKRAEGRMRSAAGGSRQHAYRCSYCGFFHLGHGHASFDSPRAPRPEGTGLVRKTKSALRQARYSLKQATDPVDIARHEKRIAGLEQHLQILKGERPDAYGVQT